MAAPCTAFEIASFYLEINPLTLKQRFHHMNPSRMYKIFLSSYKNLGPNGGKIEPGILKAMEELETKLTN